MKTVAENLNADAEEIKGLSRQLICEYSHIKIAPPSDVIWISPNGRNNWGELSVEGRRLQMHVLGKYTKYRDIMSVLLRPLTSDLQGEFKEADDMIKKHLGQEYPTWCNAATEAKQEVAQSIDKMQRLLDNLYSAEDKTLYVPDTNALLYNHQLEKWHFPNYDNFIVVLTSAVISEIDSHKYKQHRPDFAKKAESISKQIKEFNNRGDLNKGVVVVKDRISVRCYSTEPRMSESLPWLDANISDDRIIATVIEIGRQNVRSRVVLVTRDTNLQIKAKNARLRYCEPPEPISSKQENSHV